MRSEIPSMREVLLEMAQEHEQRARVWEGMADEGRTFLPPEELKAKAEQERIEAERAHAVASELWF